MNTLDQCPLQGSKKEDLIIVGFHHCGKKKTNNNQERECKKEYMYMVRKAELFMHGTIALVLFRLSVGVGIGGHVTVCFSPTSATPSSILFFQATV